MQEIIIIHEPVHELTQSTIINKYLINSDQDNDGQYPKVNININSILLQPVINFKQGWYENAYPTIKLWKSSGLVKLLQLLLYSQVITCTGVTEYLHVTLIEPALQK